MNENLAFGALTLLLSAFLFVNRQDVAAVWTRRLKIFQGPVGLRRAEWAVIAFSFYMLAVSAFAFVTAWRGR